VVLKNNETNSESYTVWVRRKVQKSFGSALWVLVGEKMEELGLEPAESA